MGSGKRYIEMETSVEVPQVLKMPVNEIEALLEAVGKRKDRLDEIQSSMDAVKSLNDEVNQKRKERRDKMKQIELKVGEAKMKIKMYRNSKVELKVGADIPC